MRDDRLKNTSYFSLSSTIHINKLYSSFKGKREEGEEEGKATVVILLSTDRNAPSDD